MRHLTLAVLLALFVLPLAACNNTYDGLGRDVEVLGNKLFPPQKTALPPAPQKCIPPLPAAPDNRDR